MSEIEAAEMRDLNNGAATAMMVGLYSFCVAAVMATTSEETWGHTSFMGWVIFQVSPWPPIAAHLVLGVALLLGTRKEERLVTSLVTSALIFAFWTFGPMVAAWRNEIPEPSPIGMLTWAWFASFCAFWAFKVRRVRRGRARAR